MKFVVDAHAWIDYFNGNNAGKKVKEFIENSENEIVTNILNLAEISSFFSRKNLEKEQIEEAFKILFSISKIYNLDSGFSKNAGLLHAKIKRKIRDFGLVDAFVLLTARKIEARVLTGDKHFKNFEEAILIT